jgi:hypothetical protein
MKSVSFIFLLLCCTSFVYSQTGLKEQKIRELMEVTGATNLGSQIAKNLGSMISESYPKVDKAVLAKLMQKIKPEEFIELCVPIYAKYFTLEDIEQLLAFYKTPVGEKIISCLPQIMQESMAAGRQWGEESANKLVKELKAKGFINQE